MNPNSQVQGTAAYPQQHPQDKEYQYQLEQHSQSHTYSLQNHEFNEFQTSNQQQFQHYQQQQGFHPSHGAPVPDWSSSRIIDTSNGAVMPPTTQFGADNSLMITHLEKELPTVPPHNDGDESTYHEYISTHNYPPQMMMDQYQPPQQYYASDVPYYPQQEQYQQAYPTGTMSSVPANGANGQYLTKDPSADPLVYARNATTPAAPSADRRISKIGAEDFEKKRNFCCCFRRRLHCIGFFVFLVVLILVLVFLALPFQFFSFIASDPFLPTTSSSGFNIASSNPLSLSFTIGENITVASPSYFTWGVHQMTVNMQLKDQKGNLIPGFNGVGFQQNLRFPARSSTLFVLPILLNYTSSSSISNFQLTTDPAYVTLQTCSNANAQLNFKLRVILDISAISWTGYFPSVDLDLARNCPKGIGPLLTSLQNNMKSQTTAGKKRKSLPQRSFPKGYRDSSPGVVLGWAFGEDVAYIKRALSSSSSVISTSSASSSESGTPSPNSPTLHGVDDDSLNRKKTRAATAAAAASSSSSRVTRNKAAAKR